MKLELVYLETRRKSVRLHMPDMLSTQVRSDAFSGCNQKVLLFCIELVEGKKSKEKMI